MSDDLNRTVLVELPENFSKEEFDKILNSAFKSNKVNLAEEKNIIRVKKRNGEFERFDIKKITKRLKNLSNGLENINFDYIMTQVAKLITDNITTYQIDELIAEELSTYYSQPEYITLAGRLKVSNHQKSTSGSFMDKIKVLYHNNVEGIPFPIIRRDFYKFVSKNNAEIQSMINYDRDFLLNYFGICTYIMIYSLKSNGKSIERPQDTFMRVAIELAGENLEQIKKNYDLLSNLQYCHGSPTIFNSGTKDPQLASCFLLGTEDNTNALMETGKKIADISRNAGGLGLHMHNVRSHGQRIKTSDNGYSSGILGFIHIYQTIVTTFNQMGKRNGSLAIYLCMHHPDIETFIDLRLHSGDQEARAHKIFPALWIPDLFMERVKDNKQWSLFDPDYCGDLSAFHSAEYRAKYLELEEQKKYKKQLPARELWEKIYTSKLQTGMPFICFSDNANKSNMQENIGVIKSSNLCTEIFEVSDSKQTAVCNLCSISLPKCVSENKFDFNLLIEITRQCVINNNNVIQTTTYPVGDAKTSNFQNRPIGIGVQGLADVYQMFEIAFESKEASDLNKSIFETIYYAALLESCNLAKKYGPYDSYVGSPISKGIFHWEMFGLKKEQLIMKYDWDTLRAKIMKYGVRNSLLVAIMPTASTSQLMGNNECIEPFTTNVYVRKTIAGCFVVFNKHLVKKLQELGLWDDKIINYLKVCNGSIAGITAIPQRIRDVYKIAREIDQKVLVQQAVDRQPFVDQGQSLNLYSEALTSTEFTKLMYMAWRGGLKTGNYYWHTAPTTKMQNFTVDPMVEENIRNQRKNKEIVYEVTEECLACSS